MKSVNHLVCAFLRRCLWQMKKLGFNQTELAKRMKVSRPYVVKLMKGDVNISFGTAVRLAKALEMDFFPDLREPHRKPGEEGADSIRSGINVKQLSCGHERLRLQ